MSEKNRREQVKEMIETGDYTKAEIAAELDVNPSSVSSQMTYLRWMGHFIVSDDDKKLRFCSEEEYNDITAAALANRKTKTTSTKTPEEQAVALQKTIANQTAQLEKAQAKCVQIDFDLEHDEANAELLEMKEEADAMATILRIKLARNKAKALELPEVEVEEAEEAEEVEAEEDLL